MSRSGVISLCVLGLVITGSAAASADETPIPDGVEVPLSSVEITTIWEAPRTTLTKYWVAPREADAEALKESLGAEQDGGDTVVQLSDRFLFDFGSAELRPTASASLDSLAVLLEETESPITITGHTDSIGADAVNQPLSEERAAAIAAYLVEQGVAQDRITTEGKGSTEPVADNMHPDGSDNPEGRQQNRRVEVRYEGG